MAASEKHPEAGAPGDEIEVTPAMIEVGLQYLLGYRPDRGIIEEEYVARMYRAMCRARG